MIHAPHDTLPGFDPRQIWFTGCPECEWRGEHAIDCLGTLDTERFARAWKRAADWNDDDLADLGEISDVEQPLLHLLWRIQVMLQRQCGLPIGELPTRVSA